MRWATCTYRGLQRLGRCDGGDVLLLPASPGATLRALLAGGGLAAAAAGAGLERVKAADLRFLPPVPDADKIICVGMNYRAHLAELGEATPRHPSLFVRFNASQVGHREPVVAPSISAEFDYEGELAVIIGRPAWKVPEERALDYVAGYSCFAENSVRDFQKHARQATAGKNFDASGAFGPWLTTADEIPDPAALELFSRLNGAVVQQTSLSDLVFSIPQLIAYITQFTRLLPGDVIATGTPSGVGFLRKPPVWLRPGDVFEVDVPGVGLLQNRVVAEAESGAPVGGPPE